MEHVLLLMYASVLMIILETDVKLVRDHSHIMQIVRGGKLLWFDQ